MLLTCDTIKEILDQLGLTNTPARQSIEQAISIQDTSTQVKYQKMSGSLFNNRGMEHLDR
jgi:hypothetical protein